MIRKLGLSAVLGAGLVSLSLPARAQFSDNMGYMHNNMESATIGTWLNGQSSMWYTRQQLYRTMARGGRSAPTASQLQEKRGHSLIRRGRATMAFAMRTPPLTQWMKGWGGDDPIKRRKAYNEWVAQSRLWRQEAKLRGARFGDMADMMGLAFVMCHEAYSGRRTNTAGFRYMSKAFRASWLKDAYYQGRTLTAKQEGYESAMLSGTWALYQWREGLRHGDQAMVVAGRETAKKFLDEWWTSDAPGATKTLAAFSGKAAPIGRITARPATLRTIKVPASARSAPTLPTSLSLAQAAAVTNFQPTNENLIPERFAAPTQNAQERASTVALCDKMIDASRAEMKKYFVGRLPDNNVARALSFSAMTLYSVAMTSEGRPLGVGVPKFSQAQATAVQEQFAQVLAGNAKFRKLSERQKQEAYEMFLLTPAMSGLLYNAALEKGNGEAQQKARQFARDNLTRIFGVAPEKMYFTNAGLELQ
ncbi:MAG TPA: DUF6683 family protein [Abditibacteriaceae bacterium]|jgi:hypothetical protein